MTSKFKFKTFRTSDADSVVKFVRENFYNDEPLVLGTAWCNTTGNNDEFDIVIYF